MRHEADDDEGRARSTDTIQDQNPPPVLEEAMPKEYKTFDWYDEPLYYDIIFDVDTEKETDALLNIYQHFNPDAVPSSPRVPASGLRLLDPASGSGRMLLEFAKRGCTHAVGFDILKGAVDFSTQKVEEELGVDQASVQLYQASMTDACFCEPAKDSGQRRNTDSDAKDGNLDNTTSATAAVAAAAADVTASLLSRAHLSDCNCPHTQLDMAFSMVSTFKHLMDEVSVCQHLQQVSRHLREGGLFVIGMHLNDLRKYPEPFRRVC